jgi:hypothetical protein
MLWVAMSLRDAKQMRKFSGQSISCSAKRNIFTLSIGYLVRLKGTLQVEGSSLQLEDKQSRPAHET